MPTADDYRKSIPVLLEEFSSIEEFLKASAPGSEQSVDLVTGSLLAYVWKELMDVLNSSSRWERLAITPKKFDRHLDVILGLVKRFMKSRYGIPAHRPTTNADRDQRIVELMAGQPSLSYGEIAIKMGLAPDKSKVVERAHKRALQKQRKELREYLEGIVSLWELAESERSSRPNTTTKA